MKAGEWAEFYLKLDPELEVLHEAGCINECLENDYMFQIIPPKITFVKFVEGRKKANNSEIIIVSYDEKQNNDTNGILIGV